jgi:hypothetical protein
MGITLTDEEAGLANTIKAASPWHNVYFEFANLVPCFAIIGFSYYWRSTTMFVTGIALYLFFHTRTLFYQKKRFPILKSLVQKLELLLPSDCEPSDRPDAATPSEGDASDDE